MITIVDSLSSNKPLDNKCNKKFVVLIISIVFLVIVLFAYSIVVYKLTTSNDGDGDGWDSSFEGVVFVKSEGELVRAVNAAWSKRGFVVVALDCDVFLSKPLVIYAGSHIVLTSNNSSDDEEFFRLVGARGERVIVVEDGGVLRLCGVVVTHIQQIGGGGGVLVLEGGELVLVRGKISDNNAYGSGSVGGGVYNMGTFRMLGGEISGNNMNEYYDSYQIIVYGSGGGVYNSGVFELLDGLIVNNIANYYGGVCNFGNFTMLGGRITNNIAVCGGGVGNFGNFTMSDGLITNNTSVRKEPFYVRGVGANNTNADVTGGGGVYNSERGVFVMNGGLVANNEAKYKGGGVCNVGIFIMKGGSIVNNISVFGGGGVYSRRNGGNVFGGVIVNNSSECGVGSNLCVVDMGLNVVVNS